MMPYAHSSVLLHSMIHFCHAQRRPHTTVYPEPFSQLAPKTKQASFGPKEVANMPAPHGQCIVCTSRGVPNKSCVSFLYISLSIFTTFFTAMTASSSPGYEIFGIGGIGQSSGFAPGLGMPPALQSPIA